MKTVGWLPAGAQLWNKNTWDSGGTRAAYSSTLAIYVYDVAASPPKLEPNTHPSHAAVQRNGPPPQTTVAAQAASLPMLEPVTHPSHLPTQLRTMALLPKAWLPPSLRACPSSSLADTFPLWSPETFALSSRMVPPSLRACPSSCLARTSPLLPLRTWTR